MKKSIGAKIRFTDGHEERFEGVTDISWRENYIVLSREIKTAELDAVVSVDRKFVIGVFDIYEEKQKE